MQCPKVTPQVREAWGLEPRLLGPQRPWRPWEGPRLVAPRGRGPWFLTWDTSSGGPGASPGLSAFKSQFSLRRPWSTTLPEYTSRTTGAEQP